MIAETSALDCSYFPGPVYGFSLHNIPLLGSSLLCHTGTMLFHVTYRTYKTILAYTNQNIKEVTVRVCHMTE